MRPCAANMTITRPHVHTIRRITAAVVLLAAAVGASAAPVLARTAETLQKLADAAGPPGFKEPVRAVLVGMMKLLATSLTYDGMGAIMATQGVGGPKILVDAHMDEVGGMVRRITPNARFCLLLTLSGYFLEECYNPQSTCFRQILKCSHHPCRMASRMFHFYHDIKLHSAMLS